MWAIVTSEVKLVSYFYTKDWSADGPAAMLAEFEGFLQSDEYAGFDTIADESTSRIVETLVRLAKDLQMTVVAEGIETEQQVQSLLACGVQEGQGYIVSPPLPCARFIELVEIRRARLSARNTSGATSLVA